MVTIGSDLPKIVSVHAYCTDVIFNSITTFLRCPSLGCELHDQPIDTVFNLGRYSGIGFIILYKFFYMYDIFQ